VARVARRRPQRDGDDSIMAHPGFRVATGSSAPLKVILCKLSANLLASRVLRDIDSSKTTTAGTMRRGIAPAAGRDVRKRRDAFQQNLGDLGFPCAALRLRRMRQHGIASHRELVVAGGRRRPRIWPDPSRKWYKRRVSEKENRAGGEASACGVSGSPVVGERR